MLPKEVSKDKISSTDTSSSNMISGIGKKAPNTRKDFKQVLQGKDDTREDDEVHLDEMKQLAKSKALKSKSIFDLSAHPQEQDIGEGYIQKSKIPSNTLTPSVVANSDIPLMANSDQPVVNTSDFSDQINTKKFVDKPEFAQEVNDLSSITPNLAALQKTPIQHPDQDAYSPQLTANDAITQKSSQRSPTSDQTSDSDSNTGSQPNITGAVATPLILTNVIKTESVKQMATTQEIIDQIVDKIYTLQVSGKTDTVITFKQLSPMFDGMQLTLTTFDTAKKEFNITFSNLTQAGQNLLEKNLGMLKSELDRLGVVTHIITFTTQNESISSNSTEEKTFRDPRDEDRNDKGQKKKG